MWCVDCKKAIAADDVHKVDVDAEDAADPYGAPSGFWLGADEVKAFLKAVSGQDCHS